MTLQEKIAALPPLDTDIDCAASFRDEEVVVRLDDYNALLARNALLCEALREAQSLLRSEYDDELDWHADTHAVLAACEVQP